MDRPRKSLKILWLEDSDPDYELAREILDADGLAAEFIRVTRRKDFQAALRRERFDAVISDFALPDYDGGSALVTARQIQPDIPFVLLSGAIGEERAVEFLKSGATDCVLKNNLARLAPVIRRALAEAQERRRRRHAEEALRGRTRELQALAGRLLAGREEERIRISREIHDELGEALTAQKIGLAWIRNRLQTSRSAGPEIFDRIEKLGQLADATAHR
ncbi:MAG TPA: response regulator, partial [Verrucomicrobiae bacterium]|nr:response regulator [Verrucomicrobiae bacterium]